MNTFLDIVVIRGTKTKHQDLTKSRTNLRNLFNEKIQESGQILRAKVFYPEYKEISLIVKVNDTAAKTIIDKGSPVTVISKGLFDRMGDEYEDNKLKLKVDLKISSIKLFSCEAEQAMNTMGECDVMIKHKEFQCLSRVIIAVDLAHD